MATGRLDPHNVGRPATTEEIKNKLKTKSVRNILQGQDIIPFFQPDPGHVCLTLTDEFGKPEEIHTVSLRHNRKKEIASRKTDLYQPFYGNLPGRIYYSQNTTFRAEVESLAKIVAHPNSTTVADITVVPFSSSLLSRDQLMLNIAKAKTSPVYSLCKTIFKEKALRNIQDISVSTCLDDMKRVAHLLDFDDMALSESDEVILGAFACTNAAVEACFGDPHFLAKNVALDLSTQATVALCCAMSLIGEEEFFNFLCSFGFYDESVALMEELDSGKIFKNGK